MPSSKLEVWRERALSGAKALKSLDDPALLQKDMWKHLPAPLGDGQQDLKTEQVRKKGETVTHCICSLPGRDSRPPLLQTIIYLQEKILVPQPNTLCF